MSTSPQNLRPSAVLAARNVSATPDVLSAESTLQRLLRVPSAGGMLESQMKARQALTDALAPLCEDGAALVKQWGEALGRQRNLDAQFEAQRVRTANIRSGQGGRG